MLVCPEGDSSPADNPNTGGTAKLQVNEQHVSWQGRFTRDLEESHIVTVKKRHTGSCMRA